MKRAERSEYTYIKNSLKKLNPSFGSQLTIRTDAGAEYKKALHELYTSLGFHPGAVKVDTHWFDDKERIIYICGLTFDLDGSERPWTELYTREEKELFAAKLN